MSESNNNEQRKTDQPTDAQVDEAFRAIAQNLQIEKWIDPRWAEDEVARQAQAAKDAADPNWRVREEVQRQTLARLDREIQAIGVAGADPDRYPGTAADRLRRENQSLRDQLAEVMQDRDQLRDALENLDEEMDQQLKARQRHPSRARRKAAEQ